MIGLTKTRHCSLSSQAPAEVLFEQSAEVQSKFMTCATFLPRCSGTILGIHIGIMDKKMETTIVHWGNIGIMDKKMETTIVHWGNIGIMDKTMETTIVHWGNIGIMDKTMETSIVHGVILG